MSRYMEAINLLCEINRRISIDMPDARWAVCRERILAVLAMPESEAEKAIRESDEMLEEAARMNGW